MAYPVPPALRRSSVWTPGRSIRLAVALTLLTGLFVVAPTGNRHVVQADGPPEIVFSGATIGWKQKTNTTVERVSRSTGAFAGDTCDVRAVVVPTDSTHENNNVIVSSGNRSVEFTNVEGVDAPDEFPPKPLELGDSVVVSTYVGNDDRSQQWPNSEPDMGFFSAKVRISFECRTGPTPPEVPVPVTLVKKVAGGSASPDEWVVRASGPEGEISGRGEASGTLPAGTYSLSESDGPPEYLPGQWSCIGGSLSGSELTIGERDAADGVACSVTNTKIDDPLVSVRLMKIVEDGPASPDQWVVSASNAESGLGISGRGEASGLLPPGTYSLSESDGPSGYVAEEWTCRGGTLSGTELTIRATDVAEGVECSITNTGTVIIPPVQLRLAKLVVGGSASPVEWVVSASDSDSDLSVSGAGEAFGLLPPGTYSLSESGGPSGYVSGEWRCRGGSLVGAELTIGAGDVADGVECSNTSSREIPPPVSVALSLTKVVDGGSALPSDWVVRGVWSGPGVGESISGAGKASGSLRPGVYSLSESDGPPGYVPGEWSCTGGSLSGSELTIRERDAAGGVRCSIASVLDPRPIEVNAHVVVRGDCRTMISYQVAADGVGEFDTVDLRLLDLDGTFIGSAFDGRPPSGMIPHPAGVDGADPELRAGGFLVAEVRGVPSEPVVFGADRCPRPPLEVEVRLDCGPVPRLAYRILAPVDGPVAITLAGPEGFVASYGDQDLEGDLLYPGAAQDPLDWPGWRRQPDGTWVEDPTDQRLAEGGVFTVTVGEFSAGTAYPPLLAPPACAPTSDPPMLTLSAPPSFDLSAPEYDPDEPLPGTYDLVASGPPGYDLPIECDNSAVDVTEVTLRAGENVTCTLDPQMQAPSLTIEKRVVNDDGGSAAPDDFEVVAVGYEPTAPEPGVYPLQQVSGPADYALSVTCDNADGGVASVTLGPGEVVSCVFVYDDDARPDDPPPDDDPPRDDDPPTNDEPGGLTLRVVVINDEGGLAGPDDWTLTWSPAEAGSYLLSHEGPDEYRQVDGWWCRQSGELDGDVLTWSREQDETCVIVYDDITDDDGSTPEPDTSDPSGSRCAGLDDGEVVCVVLDDLAAAGECGDQLVYTAFLVNRTGTAQTMLLTLTVDLVPSDPGSSPFTDRATVDVEPFGSSNDVTQVPFTVDVAPGSRRLDAELSVRPVQPDGEYTIEGAGGYETTLRRCDG